MGVEQLAHTPSVGMVVRSLTKLRACVAMIATSYKIKLQYKRTLIQQETWRMRCCRPREKCTLRCPGTSALGKKKPTQRQRLTTTCRRRYCQSPPPQTCNLKDHGPFGSVNFATHRLATRDKLKLPNAASPGFNWLLLCCHLSGRPRQVHRPLP